MVLNIAEHRRNVRRHRNYFSEVRSKPGGTRSQYCPKEELYHDDDHHGRDFYIE